MVSIVLFVRAGWFQGVLATVGSVVDGVAVKWVVARRSDAVAEEKEAYADVKNACGNTAAVDRLRAKWTL